MIILDNLCDALLDAIPPSREDVRASIKSIKYKLLWCAPELEGMRWNELISALDTIAETEPYHAEVVRLFAAASADKTAETRARKAALR